MDMMSASQIRSELNDGLSDIENGRMRPAREVFSEFRNGRKDEAI